MKDNLKKKILFLSHSPHFNGAEICLLNLIDNLDKNLFKPLVVFPDIGPLQKKIESLGVKTIISPLERWVRFNFDNPVKGTDLSIRVEKIVDIIEKETIDIVHSNTSVVLEGAIAAKITGKAHIWHIHEYLKNHPGLDPIFPLPITYFLFDVLSTKIITVSNFVSKQFYPIVETNKISTIYNGVSENNVNNKDNDFRKEFNISNDELVAVSIGLLTEAKGYDTLLEAASIVVKKGYKIKFFWVGKDIDKSTRDFKKRIKQLGLKGSVFFVGFRSDIKKILNSVDIFICPSVMETFSMVILEAMAARLPVITTDCGGPTELVAENETGFVVPVNDPKIMSEKIIELCSSQKKRKDFGSNGFIRFKDNFSLKKYSFSFEQLYIDVMRENQVTTTKDLALINSLYQIYEIVSDQHWKNLRKRK